MSDRPPTRLTLLDSVQYLPGVGPRRAATLSKLGVRTIGDLLEYLPYRYDRQEHRTVENLQEGTIATVVGQITAIRRRRGRRGAYC